VNLVRFLSAHPCRRICEAVLLPDFLDEPGVAALGLLAHHPGNCATTPRE
jgi:hypothetical protein